MRTKKIKLKDIKIGDKIRTLDDNGQICYSEVTDKFYSNVDQDHQRIVSFENGTEIKCSADHKFTVYKENSNNEFTTKLPDELTRIDRLIDHNGEVTNIVGVKKDAVQRKYIDITVEDTHRFFAGNTKKNNKPMILLQNSQGGVRGGAGTAWYPAWHYEFEDLVALKNNKGTEEARVRHLDHGFQLSRLFYQRLKDQDDITFFSPSDVPNLLDAFYKGDQTEFESLYVQYENDVNIRKKSMSALDFFTLLVNERKDTGRIYIQNVDNVNQQGSFDDSVAPIRMSNLCAEIDLPTKPMSYPDDPEGRIALCTLGAINWGMIDKPEDFKEPCKYLVEGLDNLLSYQNYPIEAARNHTEEYRPLGIGINNLAFFLAKRGLTYSSNKKTLNLIDQYAEAWAYYLTKSSIKLAKERGPCKNIKDTKYHAGITPLDTSAKSLNEYISRNSSYDWDKIRKKLTKHGIRNSTLMAQMPCESSSLVSNSTNGIEPPRALVSYKQTKDGIIPQVVPQIHHLKNKYDLLWDQKDTNGYLLITAVLQKWIDQGISVNTSYNPAHYADQKVPISKLISDLFLFYHLGGKQLYYNNTNDMSVEESVDGDEEELRFNDDDQDNDCGDVCML